ncbi:MAG: replication-associated recombination protein A [Bacilli bacterium]
MNQLQNTLRPSTLKDIIGQTHLVGNNKIFTNLVKNKQVFNMILYGKSGTGKTTIALALVNDLKLRYRLLNATINTKKDFEIVFEEAKMYGNIILIVDEIHRMNKDKQDLLLSYIENGLVTLIGLTSTNPFHTVNKAIRSRCQTIGLNDIEETDILKALKKVKSVYKDIELTSDTYKYIAKASSGDIRFAYNLIEFCYYSFGKTFTKEQIREINASESSFFDKNEDSHYDLLSAFQKSIRGSDVNASLYYLSCLIESKDFDSIHRRMLVIAYEDIGLANPMMATKVLSSINASIMLGMPEAVKPLTASVIDMALSPKSNTVETSYNAAFEDLVLYNVQRTPNHIKTTSPDYLYPHNYQNNYVKQDYLPNKLLGRIYYNPGNNKYEQEMYNYNKNLRK